MQCLIPTGKNKGGGCLFSTKPVFLWNILMMITIYNYLFRDSGFVKYLLSHHLYFSVRKLGFVEYPPTPPSFTAIK